MTQRPTMFPGPRAVPPETTPRFVPANLWVDAEEAAPILASTPHTLRRLAREGRSPITVRRIGSRWRFSRADLERFVDAAVGIDDQSAR